MMLRIATGDIVKETRALVILMRNCAIATMRIGQLPLPGRLIG
jgi:hypothetical protein